jgi:RNA polymerase-interacting CarD/CdnL/TRCF family regulator
MKATDQAYVSGDWIVHLYYGVGQIVGVEKKYLEGHTVSYFKVKTKDSTIWIPVKHSDNVRVRPIANKEEIREALNILKRKPRQMSDDHTKRKSRIKNVKEDGTLKSIARIVRDLNARQVETKLNDSEERALNQFTDRLLSEWAACLGIKIEEARKHLYRILQKVRA